MKQKVYLRKARNFGEVFGDTISYLKQNFGSFFGSVLLLVSPFVLITAILLIHLFKGLITMGTSDPLRFYASMGGVIGLMVFLYIVGSTAFLTVINEHMLINENLPVHEKVQMKQVLRNFFWQFLRGLGSMFMLIVINIVLAIAIGLVFGLFAVFIKISAFVGVLLFILFYIFFLLIVTPVLLYLFSGVMFTSQRHKFFVFEAIGKVFRNMKGNFWITWALSFLGGLIVYILSFIAFLPSYIVLIISVFTQVNHMVNAGNADSGYEVPVYLVVLFCISGLLIICIYSVYFVMMNFQCASLEEKKEGLSIMEKIESI